MTPVGVAGERDLRHRLAHHYIRGKEGYHRDRERSRGSSAAIPLKPSFTHSKHTSAMEVGQHTPAAATSNGTSRSPPGPAIRDCQYS